MKIFKHVTGVLLATIGVIFTLGAVALLADRAPDTDLPRWVLAVTFVVLGLLPLAGAFLLLRAHLTAPSRACPQCGGTQRQPAGALRRLHNPWLFHLGGWLFASLWGASRQQQVRCRQCETVYFTDTRATRIAGVVLWIFLLLILFGILAEVFKLR